MIEQRATWCWACASLGFLEDDCVGELDRIQSPTLILWGARDAFCSRADQDDLLQSIAGSQLVEYENTGHALHWEEPERFAGDVAKLTKELAKVR